MNSTENINEWKRQTFAFNNKVKNGKNFSLTSYAVQSLIFFFVLNKKLKLLFDLVDNFFDAKKYAKFVGCQKCCEIVIKDNVLLEITLNLGFWWIFFFLQLS